MAIAVIKRRFCDKAPLSAQQENIRLEHELYPGNVSYNMISCLRISGDLNIEAFKKSLNEIVRRHEIFRTTFSANESEPCQIVHPYVEISVSEKAINNLSPEEQETEIQQAIQREALLPFDLERGPLFRFVLLTLNQNEHVFLMTIHHIVMDGWSTGLFSNELTLIYEAFCNNDRLPSLSEPGIQYSDYAIWQNEKYKESREQDAKHWNDATKDAVFGEFPTDYPRGFGKKGESATRTITISADLTEKIKSFSREERATPFITLMAGFQLVLHRYTGHENLLSGCFTAGRDQSEVRELLGPYSNLSIIKTEFSGDPDFREIVKRTRRSFFDTYAHRYLVTSNLSGYRANEGSLSSILFPVVFTFQNFPYPGWKLCDLDIKSESINTNTARFDMEISIIPVKEEWEITVQYRKDIYSESTIERILNHYRNVLSSAIENPNLPICRIPMMSTAEIRQIVEDWNSEKTAYPTKSTIHQLIDAAAKENPDAIALIYNGEEISYKKLTNISNCIACRLIELGVGPEVMVGVYMKRSHNLIISLLAILKAGGAYVPLDPIYPDEKLAYMLQNSNAPILLTEKGQNIKFSGYDGKTIEIDSVLPQFSDDTMHDLPHVNICSENSAYLIYTSGSTGKPKGVLISHRNVVNCFCFMNSYIDDSASSRVWLFSTSISFDPSVLEMFWTLSRGYCVVILPNESSGKFLDIEAIPELIQKYHVSHFQGTPSVLSILADNAAGLSALKQLAKLMVGGERLPFALAKKLSSELVIDIYNVYGPTEATIWATWYRLQKSDICVPIGYPLPNYEIYILDRYLQPVPIGTYGELYIGGDGVSRGYFNDLELTANKYPPNPFSHCLGGRMYQTGDIARYSKSGIIEFLGRTDRQVKVRGHRIELGEIEAAIIDCGEVRETVVTTSGNTDIDRKLLGYIVPDFKSDSAEELDSYIRNLKEFLNRKLPEFMIPTRLTILNEFPKLPNGKIDKKSLPIPETSINVAEGLNDVLSPTESSLREIWEDALGIDGFGINDNYIDIGGNSLSVIIIINKIKSKWSVKIATSDFLENPTIKLLAILVDQRVASSVFEPSDEIVSIDRNNDMPLSFLQEVRLRYELSLDAGNAPYLHSSTWFGIKLFGNLDREALKKAFNYVINRHEVFKTAIWPIMDAVSPAMNKWDTACKICSINPKLLIRKIKFKQSVQPTVTMNLDYCDISKYGNEDKNIEIRIIADEIMSKRYRYESPPLTRATLLRVADAEHILIVAAAHLIVDAVSMRIYEKELAYAYSALVNGQSINLPDIKLQYADYTAWTKHRLEAGSLDSVKSYWQKQFDGYTPTDVTILPFTDTEGSENDADFSIETKYYHHSMSNELSDAVRKYAGSVNMTVFGIVMTGFILCLYSESGKSDIGVLTYFANRIRPEMENTIGMFATGNIIRVKVNAEDSLYQCAAIVSESLNDALTNQELVVSPPDSRTYKSLYDLVVNRPITCESLVDNECASFSGLNVERAFAGRNKSEYALRSFIVDSSKNLFLMFQYNLDLFNGADIGRIAMRTENIIKSMLAHPFAKLSSINL
jgi:amino acid adenylation domain-containing protein